MGDWFGLDYLSYQWFLMGLCLVMFGLVLLCMWRLSTSRFGMALRTLREDERAAAAFGRDIYRLKLKGYVIGAGVGGFAGALFAAYLSAFNPSAWSPVEIIVLYAAVLGGCRRNILGVGLGVFIMCSLVQEATPVLPEVPGHPQIVLALRGV